MRNTEVAFIWIVSLLNKNKIKFQISGGFAAKLYGSSRKLADIDINISNGDFLKIRSQVQQYIIFGPAQYLDSNWNIILMTLRYEGQIIDIAGGGKIYDQNKKQWIKYKNTLSNSNQILVYNILVPVINKKKLIDYKSKLLRNVDKKDIKFLTRNKMTDC